MHLQLVYFQGIPFIELSSCKLMLVLGTGYLGSEEGSYFKGQTDVCEDEVFVETENTTISIQVCWRQLAKVVLEME